MALTPEQILNIAGTPAAIPGSYIYSVARAVETEVRKQDTELIRQLLEALENFQQLGDFTPAVAVFAINAARARLGEKT